MPKRLTRKKARIVGKKKRGGFTTLLLVGLIVGLGLLMAGSFIPGEKFPKGGGKAGEVIPQQPGQSKNNLELKPLAFTTPTTPSACDYDSIKGDGCSCPVNQKYGPASDGKFYYTDKPEQECRFVAENKVNDECTLLKLCEQNVGNCSFNAPLAPGYGCPVPKSLSGEYVNGIEPPADSRNLNVNCAGWKNKILALGRDKTWCVGKPVIYLYPETPTEVDVKLSIPGDIYISIPEYPDQGWQNVLAYPDGTLIFNGQRYKELYYETKVAVKRIPANGIIIPTSELSSRLWEITDRLGLKPVEQQEFLDYWLPQLYELNKPFILFSLLDQDEKERIDGVTINPVPDVFINFIAYFKGLDYPAAVTPLKLPDTPQLRSGFTAVEWGGTIDPD